jgi:hypothetical protein
VAHLNMYPCQVRIHKIHMNDKTVNTRKGFTVLFFYEYCDKCGMLNGFSADCIKCHDPDGNHFDSGMLMDCKTYEKYDAIRKRLKRFLLDNGAKAHIIALLKPDKTVRSKESVVIPEYFLIDDSNKNDFFNNDETI